jgi:hypothetical protein
VGLPLMGEEAPEREGKTLVEEGCGPNRTPVWKYYATPSHPDLLDSVFLYVIKFKYLGNR